MQIQNEGYKITSYSINSGEFQTLKDYPSFYTYSLGGYIIETDNLELSTLFNKAYEKEGKINNLEFKADGPNQVLENMYVINKNKNQYTLHSLS